MKDSMTDFINASTNVFDQIEEVVKNRTINEFINNGFNLYNESKTWQQSSNFDAYRFILTLNPKQYVFLGDSTVFMKTDKFFLFVRTYNNLNLDIYGPYQDVKNVLEFVDKKYNSIKESASIRWFYNKDMHSVSLPLKHKPTYDSFYPMLNGPRTDYYDKFLDSEANILILLGEPGTGKTNFLKDMMNHSATETFLTYNEDLMQNDSFFVQFIQSEARFLVFEDADTYMSARSDGNYMMHRFLNVAEGLVSSKNKKIVFSTNLPSSQRIDEALLRKGRCFDLLTFRRYSEVEAQRICKDLGKPMPLGKQFPITLANLLND